MKAATANAIKTLLRMDATTTPAERRAIVSAMSAPSADAAAFAGGEWVRGARACLLLDISRATLSRWIAEKRLEARKRGNRWFVKAASMQAIL
jgi:hypothetical protein